MTFPPKVVYVSTVGIIECCFYYLAFSLYDCNKNLPTYPHRHWLHDCFRNTLVEWGTLWRSTCKLLSVISKYFTPEAGTHYSFSIKWSTFEKLFGAVFIHLPSNLKRKMHLSGWIHSFNRQPFAHPHIRTFSTPRAIYINGMSKLKLFFHPNIHINIKFPPFVNLPNKNSNHPLFAFTLFFSSKSAFSFKITVPCRVSYLQKRHMATVCPGSHGLPNDLSFFWFSIFHFPLFSHFSVSSVSEFDGGGVKGGVQVILNF